MSWRSMALVTGLLLALAVGSIGCGPKVWRRMSDPYERMQEVPDSVDPNWKYQPNDVFITYQGKYKLVLVRRSDGSWILFRPGVKKIHCCASDLEIDRWHNSLGGTIDSSHRGEEGIYVPDFYEQK